MKIHFLALIGIYLSMLPAFGQRSPISPATFNIPRQIDPEAHAVYLFRDAKVNVPASGPLQIEHHVRILILDDAGAEELGDLSIKYYGKNDYHVLSRFSGKVYHRTLEGIKSFEVKAKDQFRESLPDDYVRFNTTFPQVQPGSIIEYVYTEEIKQKVYLRFFFQQRYPVVSSVFSFSNAPITSYSFLTMGVHMDQIKQIKFGVWEASNLPAFENEHLVECPEDFRDQVRAQMASHGYNGYVEELLGEWEEFGKLASNTIVFADLWKRQKKFKVLASNACEGLTDQNEIIRSVRKLIQSNVVWNGENALGTKDNLYKVWESGEASRAQMNFILIAMLREMGIEAYPMYISTKSHGVVTELWPLVSQFNTALAHVKGENGDWTLDATDPFLPMELLPSEVAVPTGIAFDRAKGWWVPIAPNQADISRLNVSYHISESGEIAGTIVGYFSGQEGAELRKYLKYNTDEQSIIEFLDHIVDNDAETVEWLAPMDETPEDLRKPVKIKANFEYVEETSPINGLVYLTPIKLPFDFEYAFNAQTRDLPIQFPYKEKVTITEMFHLPANWTSEELPEDKLFKLEGGGFTASNQHQLLGNQLMISRTYSLQQTYFAPQSFPKLKGMIDQIGQISEAPLVFRVPDSEAH
ncbi:DUF3857 domain-containing protein [Pontibacter sp. G13]|uniref:DUF3857 domain-containing protein n=1 Tax=Pontibacter sp. G13 TaxID=3074898 RepID=UPI0028890367|nr:DUF3857 domain-containing protein [Pontibacter sp. G13]WNJ16095.1 DUF3857 domain-containing protein [Pontibacter sp. G13]